MHFVKLSVCVVGSSDLFAIGISITGDLAANEKRARSPKQPRPFVNSAVPAQPIPSNRYLEPLVSPVERTSFRLIPWLVPRWRESASLRRHLASGDSLPTASKKRPCHPCHGLRYRASMPCVRRPSQRDASRLILRTLASRPPTFRSSFAALGPPHCPPALFASLTPVG